MPSTYSEQDLAGLSEEERRVLQDVNEDDEDVATALADGEQPPAQAASESDDGAAAAAEATATAATPEPTPAPPPAPEFTPQFNAGDLTQFDAQIAELTTQKNEKFAKLMEGEITPEDYSKAEAELMAARENLTIARTLAKANADAAEQYQLKVLKKVAEVAKSDDIDYAKDVKAAARFDAEIAFLSADPEWRSKDFSEKAAEAHKTVLTLLGKKPSAAPSPAPAPASVDRSKLPPTLSNIPVAAAPSIGGEFDHLDGLKGAAHEKALARMTPEQQERYLQ